MPTPSRRDLANAIRFLAVDAVEAAKSGHPGMPMGMADIAEVLWNDFHRHSPDNPKWLDRDRFVLSNGHGSMLLYGLLHLSGYDLPMAELKAFRQMHSKTPGHPEVGLTPGVETTTGPLGQGISNAVGIAIAERMLAAQFNRPGFDVFAGLVQRGVYCCEVMAVDIADDAPAIGLEACRRVVAEPALDVAVDGDAVVVVDDDELA